MKGIILAGGTGTRLYPLTITTSKQLLPVYNKPMIYYPLSTLMLAGIKDILIITTLEDISNFKKLLDDGSQFGIKLSYIVQPSPDGLAQAFLLGEEFICNESCAMILGDNIFYGNGLNRILKQAVIEAEKGTASIFGYYVSNPECFGVVELDLTGKIISLEEKPPEPKSNYCITGLYFYDKNVVNMAKDIKPSARGELEITDLNKMYFNNGNLKAHLFGRGFAWLDMGTIDSLIDASTFVQVLQKKQGIEISAPEEIAYINGWINKKEILDASAKYGNSPYAEHLKRVAEGMVKY